MVDGFTPGRLECDQSSVAKAAIEFIVASVDLVAIDCNLPGRDGSKRVP